jgi:SpoVK/Ycf46/Vps4 family AAA+-type ATPase
MSRPNLPWAEGDRVVDVRTGREGFIGEIRSFVNNATLRADGHVIAEYDDGRTEAMTIDDALGCLQMINAPGDDMTTTTKKTEPTVTFESVILEEEKKEQIVAAISQIDNNDLIFKKWGFGKVFEKGTAISLLFYGPPGTGKTLMAQAIADKFGYKLKIITTAEIESSEPGQAERNLAAFFKNSSKKTVLLFDECDGLIAPRNEVGMILGAQINALLMGLEKFTGIAIFTTNRLGRLDEAFDRRVSLKLEFAMPDHAHRIKIWERMFPLEAPLSEDVNFSELAEVEIAGGHIKNTVLRAARMAAHQPDVPADERRITQGTLLTALDQEVSSMSAFQDAINNTPGQPKLRGGAGLEPQMVGGQMTIQKVRTMDKVKKDVEKEEAPV